MQSLFEFLEKHGLLIWFIMMIYILSIFLIKGKGALKLFANLDDKNIIYSEKYGSGYSTKSFRSKHGGVRNILRIIITDKELILKTPLLLAYIAQKHDMLQRIPLERIYKTERTSSLLNSGLHVFFKNENGEDKEIVLKSNRLDEIAKILNKYT